jgi:hypothetical protein
MLTSSEEEASSSSTEVEMTEEDDDDYSSEDSSNSDFSESSSTPIGDPDEDAEPSFQHDDNTDFFIEGAYACDEPHDDDECDDDDDDDDDDDCSDDSELIQPARTQPEPPATASSLAAEAIAGLFNRGDGSSMGALVNTPGLVPALIRVVRNAPTKSGPTEDAVIRALKAIARTPYQDQLHRHGAANALLSFLSRKHATRHEELVNMVNALSVLRDLWRSVPPTSQAECVAAIKGLSSKCMSTYAYGSLRAPAMLMVTDLVLTKEDAATMTLHRDDVRLPPLSAASLARIAAVQDIWTVAMACGEMYPERDGAACETVYEGARLIQHILRMDDEQWGQYYTSEIPILLWSRLSEERKRESDETRRKGVLAVLAALSTFAATSRADMIINGIVGANAAMLFREAFAHYVRHPHYGVRMESLRLARNILANCSITICESFIRSKAFKSLVRVVIDARVTAMSAETMKAALSRCPSTVAEVVSADTLQRIHKALEEYTASAPPVTGQ